MSVRPQENNNMKDGVFIPLPELKSSTKDPREMTYMYWTVSEDSTASQDSVYWRRVGLERGLEEETDIRGRLPIPQSATHHADTELSLAKWKGRTAL